MYEIETELLFPARLIYSLRDLRGKLWHELIVRVVDQPPKSVDMLAFVLLMVRLNGCVTCNMDTYRAMLGCAKCSRQSVERFRQDDQILIKQFEKARSEVVVGKLTTSKKSAVNEGK